MGLENSFMSLGRVFGPLWAGMAYDINMTLPFWSGAIMQGIALLASFRYLKIPQAQPQAQPSAPEAAMISSE